VIWSEHLPTFLLQMFGPPVAVYNRGDAHANAAPEPGFMIPWVPAHSNDEPPF